MLERWKAAGCSPGVQDRKRKAVVCRRYKLTGCADSFAYVLVPGKVERGTKLARLMQHSWSSADLETSQRHLHHLKHYLQVRLNLIIAGFALIMHC